MSDNKLANPAALGLGGFAMTTFLLNFVSGSTRGIVLWWPTSLGLPASRHLGPPGSQGGS